MASRVKAAALAAATSLVCCSLGSCGSGGRTVTLGVPGRSNEGVTLAALGNFVAAAWSGADSAGMDIYSAVSTDGGATFGAPVRVNADVGDARAGGEQPPQVALVPASPTPVITVVWTSKRADGTRLLVARSDDGGRTYNVATVVRGSDAQGNRGWESVAVDSAGNVVTAWLDHRNAAAAPGAMHHQHNGTSVKGARATPTIKQDPVEKAELSQLMFTSIGDTEAPRSVASGVCYCCKTALAAGAEGRVFAAWRHVFPGNQRDIAFAESRDAGRTFSAPIRVSDDHWMFDGCPENGPAIAVDNKRRVHVAWPTPLDGKVESRMALFYAVSPDGGAFTPRTRIPTHGPAFHVRAAAAPDGSVILVWEEQLGAPRRIRLARAAVDGARVVFTGLAIGGAPAGSYPAIAMVPGAAIVAWVNWGERESAISVTRISIR